MNAKWNQWIVAGVVAAGLVSFSASDARADRRSSLAGNLLMEDADDVYIYPQLTLEHRNLISFDYFAAGPPLTAVLGAGSSNESGQNSGGLGGRDEAGAPLPSGQSSMSGGALLLFGQETFAFGVSIHREDPFGATPQAFLGVGDLQLYGPSRLSSWSYLGYNSPIPAGGAGGGGGLVGSAPQVPQAASGVAGFLEPMPFIDVLAGFSLGGGNSLGVRLAFGQSFWLQRRVTSEENSDSWSTTALDLTVGYSIRRDFKLDLNLELGLGFFSNEFRTSQQQPDYVDGANIAPSFSLSGRALVPLADPAVELGVIGMVHVNSSSFDDQFGATGPTTADSQTFSTLNFILEAGAGPVYTLPDKTTVAAYGTLGFGNASFDCSECINPGVNEGLTFSSNSLMLPGFKLSMEHWLTDWFSFRTGAHTRYFFNFQSRNFDDANTPNVAERSSSYEFLWSAGIGLRLKNFELNGTVTTPFVTSGPNFISGSTTGLFSLLNASYKF